MSDQTDDPADMANDDGEEKVDFSAGFFDGPKPDETADRPDDGTDMANPVPGEADSLPDSFICIERSIQELPGQADRKRALLWLGNIKKLVLPNI